MTGAVCFPLERVLVEDRKEKFPFSLTCWTSSLTKRWGVVDGLTFTPLNLCEALIKDFALIFLLVHLEGIR